MEQDCVFLGEIPDREDSWLEFDSQLFDVSR